MGRTYWYECGRCGYRAKVSGKADRGVAFAVQTIFCRDCKKLYDAVTRLRVPDESPLSDQWRNAAGLRKLGFASTDSKHSRSPSFDTVLNMLPPKGARRYQWLQYRPQCPASTYHKVQAWSDPGDCPVCGVPLEKSVLPYRIWE